MSSVVGRPLKVALAVTLFTSVGWAAVGVQNPTISLQAVKLNPVCIGGNDAGFSCMQDCDCTGVGARCGGEITPTNNITANPGDIIVAEVFAREWSPVGEKLRSFQVEIPNETTDERGSVRIAEALHCCSASTDCAIYSAFATCSSGICVNTPLLDARAGAVFSDDTRADYVFPFVNQIRALDLAPDAVRFASVVFNPAQAGVFTAPPKYIMTVAFVVSDDACGTFAVDMVDQNFATGLFDDGAVSTPITPLTLENLTITMQNQTCNCRQILAADPPNCSIDARRPAPSGEAWKTFRLTMDCGDTADAASVGLWDVTQTGGFPPSVSSVVADGADVIVTLTRPISSQRWTCLIFNPAPFGTRNRACFGILPADVDASLTSDMDDVGNVLDCVRGDVVGGCGDWQCDANRSGLCTPSDMLTAIDLLNGGSPFAPWDGESIGNNTQTLICPADGL